MKMRCSLACWVGASPNCKLVVGASRSLARSRRERDAPTTIFFASLRCSRVGFRTSTQPTTTVFFANLPDRVWHLFFLSWLCVLCAFVVRKNRQKPDFLGKKPGNKLNQPSEIVWQPKREWVIPKHR